MSANKTNHVIAEIGSVPYTTTIKASNHIFYTDEPESEGGAGKGPGCHDLLLASLVSCTCITLKMYAQTKGWVLDGVKADAQMERRTEHGFQITEVVIKLKLSGSFDMKQKQKMLFVATKCPVHKTLAPAMKIAISLLP